MSVAAMAGPQAEGASSQSSEQPSYAALADLLENEQTRNDMISQLRSLAQGEAPSAEKGSGAEAEAGVPPEQQSLGGRIANMTQGFARGLPRMSPMPLRLSVVPEMAKAPGYPGRSGALSCWPLVSPWYQRLSPFMSFGLWWRASINVSMRGLHVGLRLLQHHRSRQEMRKLCRRLKRRSKSRPLEHCSSAGVPFLARF